MVSVRPFPNEDPERAIKRFLNRCKKVKIVEQYVDSQTYVKPSKKNRKRKAKPIDNGSEDAK